jgi:hypothetical protein
MVVAALQPDAHGYQQIGARLTPQGLGQNYKSEETSQALGWAAGISLLVVVALSNLAGEAARSVAALEKMRAMPSAPRPTRRHNGSGHFDRSQP